MTTVTHLAGPVVAIKGRAIQRCSICGEKLVDLDMANSDGVELAALPTGNLVHQDDEGRWWVLPNLACENDIPADLCLELVEV